MVDNCPEISNPSQTDSDEDGIGDACDLCSGDDTTGDNDSDAVCNDIDLDDDNDGMPDDWENQYNLNSIIDDADEDFDDDGWSNLQEYLKGTIPNDADSHPQRAMPWLPLLLGDD